MMMSFQSNVFCSLPRHAFVNFTSCTLYCFKTLILNYMLLISNFMGLIVIVLIIFYGTDCYCVNNILIRFVFIIFDFLQRCIVNSLNYIGHLCLLT